LIVWLEYSYGKKKDWNKSPVLMIVSSCVGVNEQ